WGALTLARPVGAKMEKRGMKPRASLRCALGYHRSLLRSYRQRPSIGVTTRHPAASSAKSESVPLSSQAQACGYDPRNQGELFVLNLLKHKPMSNHVNGHAKRSSGTERLKELMTNDSGFAFDPRTGYTYMISSTGLDMIRWLKEGLSFDAVLQRVC